MMVAIDPIQQRATLENFLVEPSINSIRKYYINSHYSLPYDTPAEIIRRKEKKVGTSLRGRIWKACIFKERVELDVDLYCDLLEKNHHQSEEFESIYGDVKRSYRMFEERVEAKETRRLLQGFVLKEGLGWYSQALPYPAALFLMHMSEIEAFYLFTHWIKEHAPMIYRLDGSAGIFAVLETSRMLLAYIDPVLEQFISDAKVDWRLFGLPWISSFFAQQNELDQVVKLWDFFALFGFHLISLVTAVCLIQKRDIILNLEQDRMKISKQIMDFKLENVTQIIDICISLVPEIPDHLYSLMVNVMTKPEVASSILKQEVTLRRI